MAQSDQSFPDSASKTELLASGLHPQTMKHIFLESCLLKIARSPLVYDPACNLSTT